MRLRDRRSRIRWSGRRSSRTPSRSTRRSSTPRASSGRQSAGSIVAALRPGLLLRRERRELPRRARLPGGDERPGARSARTGRTSGRRSSPGRGRRCAMRAARRRVGIVLVLVAAVSTFAFNFNVLLPVLARETLDSGPEVFGILSACFGAGRARRRAALRNDRAGELRAAAPRARRALGSPSSCSRPRRRSSWPRPASSRPVSASRLDIECEHVASARRRPTRSADECSACTSTLSRRAALGGLLSGWLADDGRHGTRVRRRRHDHAGRDRRRTRKARRAAPLEAPIRSSSFTRT